MPVLSSASSSVTDIPAASHDIAADHFQRLLTLETDCWDVHAATASTEPGFVLLDVRGTESFRHGHLPCAISLPHGRINERNLSTFPKDALFVVYCAGPHCNGADRAALRLARLGRKVKKMIGGVTGWLEEGYTLVSEKRQAITGGGKHGS